MDNINNPIFTSTFKKFKCKDYIPNYDDLICFNQEFSHFYSKYILSEPKIVCPPGILPVQQWESYYLYDHPGLIIISNLFSDAFQKFIVMRSLENYINKPNKTNLNVSSINAEELWMEYKKDPIKRSKDIKKLRWATMGFHHNWDTKVYDLFEKTVMPKEIRDCCKYIAYAVGYHNYNAEASIINFYHNESTLSGHTDHSEQDQKSPIISISFGCSAIFLIGGESKEDKCSAILIKNGDVVIMSKHSRLCYHAVPKILTRTYNLFEYKLLGLNKNDDTLQEFLTINKSNCLHIEKNEFVSEKNQSNNDMKEDESTLSNKQNRGYILLPDTKFSRSICQKNKITKSISNNSNNHTIKSLAKINDETERNLNCIPDLSTKDDLTNVFKSNIKCEISIEELCNHYIISNEMQEDNPEDIRIKRFKCENTHTSFFNKSNCDWNIYHNFLLNARININVRQVKPN